MVVERTASDVLPTLLPEIGVRYSAKERSLILHAWVVQ